MNGRIASSRRIATARIAILFACALMAAHAGAEAARELDDLSLEELTTLQFSTAARRAQNASDIAAAVFIITQDEIRRSGARSIPEALRLAPGLQVAQIDANRWAISARGFNGRFANKLLVLMDGRTLYTPSYSGTYWDVQDTLLHDVERIEVIRGPAGTIWGANAVNGIINIISKNAAQTSGLALSAAQSERGDTSAAARLGAVDTEHAWRVYTKLNESAPNQLANGLHSNDGGRQVRGGARMDIKLNHSDALTIAAEAYRGRSGQTISGQVMTPLEFDEETRGIADREAFDGAWSNASWTRTLGNESQLEVQTYLDHFDRSSTVYSERRDTLDLHIQHSLAPIAAHRFTWGLGLRYSQDRFIAENGALIDPSEAVLWLLSGYAQDEISAFDDRVLITLGVRIEDADYGGTAVLPNARALLSLTPRSSIWASIAQGERRPSRVERGFALLDMTWAPLSAANPLPIPVVMDLVGNPDFHSEEVIAYELGWRWSTTSWSFDAAAFFNNYSKLRGSAGLLLQCEPSGQSPDENPLCLFASSSISGESRLANTDRAEVYGVEALVRWSPLRQWRLTASYTLLEKGLETNMLHPAFSMFLLGQDPRHQFQLRSSVSLGASWDCDVAWRTMSRLRPHRTYGYDELNTRVAWRPSRDWELAIVGYNLLHDRHMEAVSELTDLLPTAIERSVALQLRWSLR